VCSPLHLKVLYIDKRHTHTHTHTHAHNCLTAIPSTVASGVVVWVWPPGAHFYLGESVVLRCNVSTAAAVAADTRPPQRGRWSYRWFRHRLHGAPPSLDPRRHLASGDTYTITGATAEDGGSYWCQAEAPGPGVNGSIVLLLSERVHLTVSGEPPSTTQSGGTAVKPGFPSPFMTQDPANILWSKISNRPPLSLELCIVLINTLFRSN